MLPTPVGFVRSPDSLVRLLILQAQYAGKVQRGFACFSHWRIPVGVRGQSVHCIRLGVDRTVSPWEGDDSRIPF